MCGPQIRLCLFTFRPIASKQLNTLTTIDAHSWLGGAVVMDPLWLQEVPGWIPGSCKWFFMFYFFYFIVVVFLPFVKTHYVSQNDAIPFAMLIYLVYLTFARFVTDYKGIKIQT